MKIISDTTGYTLEDGGFESRTVGFPNTSAVLIEPRPVLYIC